MTPICLARLLIASCRIQGLGFRALWLRDGPSSEFQVFRVWGLGFGACLLWGDDSNEIGVIRAAVYPDLRQTEGLGLDQVS